MSDPVGQAAAGDLPLPVVVYHAVERRLTPDITTVSPQRFRRQLLAWRRQQVQCITLEAYLERRGRLQPGERLLLLTFDDGYQSLEEEALPLLEQLNYPAVLFPVMGYCGAANSWDPARFGTRRRHFTGAQLVELAARGFDIGNHGLAHCEAGRLTPAQLAREWRASHQLLLDSGLTPRAAAWPFGRGKPAAARLLAELGYQAAFGLAAADSWPWAVPRLPIYRCSRVVDYAELVRRYRSKRLLQRLPGVCNRLSGLFQRRAQKMLGEEKGAD